MSAGNVWLMLGKSVDHPEVDAALHMAPSQAALSAESLPLVVAVDLAASVA